MRNAFGSTLFICAINITEVILGFAKAFSETFTTNDFVVGLVVLFVTIKSGITIF